MTIDLHAHLLPGLDDGPAELAGSLALAQSAVAAGTRVMAATPHVNATFAVAPAELADRVATMARALADAGIALRVEAGGELAHDRALELSDDELRAVTLGTGGCVLLECPFTHAGPLVARLVGHLQGKGHRVLLAHPERSPEFLQDPARLAALVRRGAFAQLTAGSLRGDFGRTVQRGARAFLEQGLAHVVASDAHDAVQRPPSLLPVTRAALERWRQPPELADWLCTSAPRALLDGDPVPPGPAWRASGPRRFLRRAARQ
jgi:protein-tyrosine phosphatase